MAPTTADAACLALVAWLALASAAAAALTVADKRRARLARRRVRERTLLAWAAVGGWPGGLAAMLLVRHKTRKAAFLAPFAAVALANGLLAWWALRGLCPQAL